ncbi:3,4-dihydroxy-2-butanone-4-phosphate synthase [Mycolicibacterium sp. 120322]
MRSPVDDLRDGRPVIVQSEGADMSYLVLSGKCATARSVAFVVRWTTGFLRVTVTDAIRHRLELPLLSTACSGSDSPQFAVSVDASFGIKTGISAADRAHTVRVIADPASSPSDLTRPGHVVPVRTDCTATVDRWSMSEYAATLARLGGLGPATVFSEITDDRGQLATATDAREFAAVYDLALINSRDLRGA